MLDILVTPTVLLDLLWWIRDGGPSHPRSWDVLGLFGNDH